jgi:surface polysaccharide O-acyltransferase-like enzyme
MSTLEIKKYAWLDLVRSLGAFFVILIHVSETYAESFNLLDSLNWMSVIFWNVLPRSAVPLFVACSGYVLLEKQDSVSNRIYKSIEPLVFWSLFYGLLTIALKYQTNPQLVEKLFIRGIFGVWAFSPHLWFLYMLLGLYISLPLSRLIFKHLDFKGYQSLCIAFILNSLIYHLVTIWSLLTGEVIRSFYSLGLGWGSIYFGYFLLPKLTIDRQYFKEKILSTNLDVNVISTCHNIPSQRKNINYLSNAFTTNRLNIRDRPTSFIYGLLASISIAIILLLTIFDGISKNNFTRIWVEPESILIIIHTFSILLWFQSHELSIERIFRKFTVVGKIVKISSRYSLGIYAMHLFMMKLTLMSIDRIGLQQYLSKSLFIAIPIISTIVWILSLLVSIVASKNNFFKRVV